MPKKYEHFTTLKVSYANLKRLFRLKQDPEDTYDMVLTRLLDEKEVKKK